MKNKIKKLNINSNKRVHTGYGHVLHKAKKSLGQNFLKSKGALIAMCNAGEVGPNDTVLEIGPGKGALTEFLLERAKTVVAVEKDMDLVLFLKDKFKKEILERKLLLIEGDILNEKTCPYPVWTRGEGRYKIVANIPYNITGAIFRKFLSGPIKPSNMTVLVQKEVAERVVARDGKESILSISVQVYGTPKYITKVSKKYFSPAPKVDSAILQIKDINSHKNLPFKNEREERWFFEVLKAGFAHKRKVLRSNLGAIAMHENIQKAFEKLSISDKARAEDIKAPQWIRLAQILSTEK